MDKWHSGKGSSMVRRWYTSEGWLHLPPIPSLNRATRYGDGIFETMAVRKGQILRHNYHLNRASEGWAQYGMGPDQALLLRQCPRLLADLEEAEGVLRWFAIRGGDGLGYAYDPQAPVIEFLEWEPRTVGYLEENVRLEPIERVYRPNGPVKVKSLRPLTTGPVPLRGPLQDYLIHDGGDHSIVSGLSGALWVYTQGTWRTPHEATGCLLSTTRQAILDAGVGQEIESERRYTLADLDQIEAVVITSALGVKIVSEIGQSRYALTQQGLFAARALYESLFTHVFS